MAEPEGSAKSGQLSKSQKGVRRATWMMLASFPLTLFVGLLTAIEDAFAVLLLIPLLCFLAGFVRLLYGVFWEERKSRVKADALQTQVGSANPQPVAGVARTPELRAARATPVEGLSRPRMKTAEMAQPPSVTENTTRLLDE